MIMKGHGVGRYILPIDGRIVIVDVARVLEKDVLDYPVLRK